MKKRKPYNVRMAENAYLARKQKLRQLNAQNTESHAVTYNWQRLGMPIQMSEAYNITPNTQQIYTAPINSNQTQD